MKAKIHYNGEYQDELPVEGETIEEIREIAFAECDKRGWKHRDCWSEVIKEEGLN
jgi:hypothetical protein